MQEANRVDIDVSCLCCGLASPKPGRLGSTKLRPTTVSVNSAISALQKGRLRPGVCTVVGEVLVRFIEIVKDLEARGCAGFGLLQG